MNERVSVTPFSEWETRELARDLLTPADEPLLRELADQESGRLQIQPTWSGVRVQTRSWVGVVRFHRFDLRIEPNLVDGNEGLLGMIEFTSGLDALHRTAAFRDLDTSGCALFELVALLLAEACEQLVRQGLVAGYRQQEADLGIVRGRLLVEQQIRRRFGRVDRLECRFDEHDQDIQENQLLAAALALCSQRVQHPGIRLRVRRLHHLLTEICSPDGIAVSELLAPVSYHRMNQHYRDAHGLARLVFEGLAVKDLLSSGETESFAFLINMGALFERFVQRLLERVLPPLQFHVHYQHRRRGKQSILWDLDQDKPYTHVAPDMLIERKDDSHRRLPVDAKYKPYDRRQISSSDIYQTFLYAYAYGAAPSLRRALILHPATPPEKDTATAPLRLAVRDPALVHGAEISRLALPIPGLLKELRGLTLGPLCDETGRAIETALAAG